MRKTDRFSGSTSFCSRSKSSQKLPVLDLEVVDHRFRVR